jgi:hypothetical protein
MPDASGAPKVEWSEEDGEYVATWANFYPSLSWLAATPDGAMKGLCDLILRDLSYDAACLGLLDGVQYD